MNFIKGQNLKSVENRTRSWLNMYGAVQFFHDFSFYRNKSYVEWYGLPIFLGKV